jgi:hypothetical protein
VAARIDAFESGMNRLLNPDRRLGIRSMKLTTKASFVPDSEYLSLRHPLRDRSGAPVNVPQGTPINFLANVRADQIMAKMEELGRPLTPQEILDLNQCPDVIEDRGHYFGAGLEDEDQKALMSVLKRL